MHNSKYLLAFGFFLYFSFNSIQLIAQETISSLEVETQSLQLYQAKNWTELIDFIKKALDKKNDYFYLRMRIGIAYYELKNYTKAEEQFKKALSFNSTDELAKEYLYYSYLFNSKPSNAKNLSTTFSKALSEKLGISNIQPIKMIFVEGGTKTSDSSNYYNKRLGDRSNYFNNAVYVQGGFAHSIGTNNSLTHAATYFNQTTNLGTITQLQYYVNGAFSLKNDWHLSPSIHWINLSSTRQITIMQPPQGGPNMGNRTITTKAVNNYFVGSIELQKRINNITLALGTTISNVDNITQIIHTGNLSLAPFGNTHLIFGTSAYLHTTNSYTTINSSFAPFIYLEPTKWLSVKGSYLVNNNANTIEMNGYLVNNSIDLTNSRWSILVNGVISKHVTIYGLYQLEKKQEAMEGFNYKYSVLVSGLKIIL